MSTKDLSSKQKIAIAVCILGAFLILGIIFGFAGALIKVMTLVACIVMAVGLLICGLVVGVVEHDEKTDDPEYNVFVFACTVLCFIGAWLVMMVFTELSGIALCSAATGIQWLFGLVVFGAVYAYAAPLLIKDKVLEIMEMLGSYRELICVQGSAEKETGKDDKHGSETSCE